MSAKKIYTPQPGEQIDYSARQAIALAKKEQTTVTFKFNNIALDVGAQSKPEDVVASYNKKSDDIRQAYNNSPEGRTHRLSRDAEVATKQGALTQYVDELDAALQGGLKTLIPWVKKYAENADDVRVDYHGDLVLEKLVAAGYKAGEYTGKDFVQGDKNIMGRYIIGQVMSCLDGSGPFGKMPPHPMTIASAEKWETMPDGPATKKTPPKLG